MDSLQNYLKVCEGMIKWTPARPEKRNAMSANWSRDDCPKHVANKIATGKVDFDIDCQYELIELQAKDIKKDLIIPNSWSLQMKDGTTPISAGLQQKIDNWRLDKYLQKRDEYRAELAIPRPPRWTDTTPALAAQVYDIHKSSYHRHHAEAN